jgi:hypothetical protein
MLRKWNDQHSCQPITCKGMDGTLKFWYFARYTAFNCGAEGLIIFQRVYIFIIVF